MEKKQLYHIIFFSFITVFVLGLFAIKTNLNPLTLKTDSGFDTDYNNRGDSGSSNSNYGGSNYYDRDLPDTSKDYNSKKTSSGALALTPGKVFSVIIFFGFFISYIFTIAKNISFSDYDEYPNKTTRVIVIIEIAVGWILLPLYILYSATTKSKTEFITPVDIVAILLTIIWFVQFSFYKYLKKRKTYLKPLNEHYEISNEELQKILPEYNLSSLSRELYNTYVEIQTAWMDYDYEKIKENTTNELYNGYKSQLEVMNSKNGKNVMSGFKLLGSKIFSVEEQNDVISVKVFMAVKLIDYIENNKTGKVTQGKKHSKIVNNYIMTFVRAKTRREYECPNCGKSLNIITTQICPYCNSTIVVNPNKFVLSKKTNIRTDRR